MLYNYTNQHPIASRFMSRLLVGEQLQNTVEQSRSLAHSIPLVALKLVRGEKG
jgi:hypothetical protein